MPSEAARPEWLPVDEVTREPDTLWKPGRIESASWPQMGFVKAYALWAWGPEAGHRPIGEAQAGGGALGQP